MAMGSKSTRGRIDDKEPPGGGDFGWGTWDGGSKGLYGGSRMARCGWGAVASFRFFQPVVALKIPADC